MAPAATAVVLQTTTATPGVGPEQLVDYWSTLVRAAWFGAGFLVVAVLGWYVIEPAVSRIVRRRNRNNPTIHEAITRYLRLAVLVLGFFAGAGMAGYGQFLRNSALVIAALTLAIGVAAQSVIGSLVSGLVLVMDRKFNVGNYIEWAGSEGTVRSITLRVTRVETPDGELVTIPNTVLTSQAITRPYGRGRYRVVEHVGVAYEADVNEALRHLTDAAEGVSGILEDPAPSAYVDEFGADAVVIRVHYWIERPHDRNIFRLRSQYAQAAKHRLDEAGVTISPPSKRELLGRIGVDDRT